MNISDDDDDFYEKPKGKQKSRSGRNLKLPTARQVKLAKSAGRQKRGRNTLEEDSLSENDSGDDSDVNFGNAKRGANNWRKNGRRSVRENISSRNSELRSSTRSVRKVSYAESEESEELDEGKKKKSQRVRIHHLIYRTHLFYSVTAYILCRYIFLKQKTGNIFGSFQFC